MLRSVLGIPALAALVLGTTGLGGAPAAGEEVEPQAVIEIHDFFFEPETVVVDNLNLSVTIKWVNKSPARAHHPIGDPHDHENLDPDACFNARVTFPEIILNAPHSRTVTIPAGCGPVVQYHCHIHSEMLGKIIIVGWLPGLPVQTDAVAAV